MKKLLFIFVCIIGIATDLHAQQHVKYRLIMRNRGEYTLWDGVTVKTYGFALKLAEQPGIPGPTLIANEGDTVTILAWNVSQGEPHTIHLHGLDVDQANDGVAHTSFEIKHMEEKSYKFIATHAGTFLYHCHVASVVHLQMGMYGLLKIHPKDGAKSAWTGGPRFDKQYSWLTSEMDKKWHDAPPEINHGDTTDMRPPVKIPKYLPTYFLVNGKSDWQLSQDTNIFLKARAGEKVYLRLANIGYFENRIIIPPALKAEFIDSDGRPLPASMRQDTMMVSPGERYGVMLSADALLKDSIEVQFINMNSHQKWKSHFINVQIDNANSIDEMVSAFKTNIYPNPAEEIATIDNLSPGASIRVFNIIGEVVGNFTATDEKLTFPTAGLPTGSYSVIIRTATTTRVFPLTVVH